MTKKTIPSALALAALVVTLGIARAQTSPAASAAKSSASETPESSFEQFMQKVKKPASDVTLSGDFRARNEYYNNIVTLAHASLHEQDVIRYRGRIAALVPCGQELVVNTRLAFEARQWMHPSFVGSYKGKTGMEWRYGILDSLSLKYTSSSSRDLLTMTVGRQDILLGDFYDWWLVVDGTPGDGSWTMFFDSARLTSEIKGAKTKFDLIYINQKATPDAWMPTIGSSTSYPLTDQDEQGAILYVSNKSIKNTQIDAYLIYKNDRRQTFNVAGVLKTPGDNADIGTIGSKITGTPAEKLSYSFEGAFQFGSKYDRISGAFARRDVRAYGGKGKITYSLKDSMKNQFSLVGEYLSGDDPSTTGRDEMFDILWGRWPRWSELYIYSYINETSGRIAQLNNLARYGLTWNCAPRKGMSVGVAGNLLYAPQSTPTRTVAPALFTNNGHFRGYYAQVTLKQQFNKYLSGHLWAEAVWQGDFYTKREMTTFLRAEIMFSF